MFNKNLFTIILCLLSSAVAAQINYDSAYFINDEGQKIECFIKNKDWRDNPESFEYKLTENSETQKAKLSNVKEFGILQERKFIRATVKLDMSSEDISNLSEEKEPSFKTETVFLDLVIEGKANLYHYRQGVINKFFFKKEADSIIPLVYKKYIQYSSNASSQFTGDTKNIVSNNAYKQFLFNQLKSDLLIQKDFIDLDYKKRDLQNLFFTYNKGQSENFKVYQKKKIKGEKFNLNIRPRYNLISLSISNSASYPEGETFKGKGRFGIGLEFEILLPFNKNKWAIAVEPTWYQYNNELITPNANVSGGIAKFEVNYNSMTIPLGIRHYFFLSENSKIFFNASYNFNLKSESNFIVEKRADNSEKSRLEIISQNSISFGLGYKQNNKFIFEFRYLPSKDLLNTFTFWDSEYSNFSIIIGYTLF